MCTRCHNLSLKSDATYITKEIQMFEVNLFAKTRLFFFSFPLATDGGIGDILFSSIEVGATFPSFIFLLGLFSCPFVN